MEEKGIWISNMIHSSENVMRMELSNSLSYVMENKKIPKTHWRETHQRTMFKEQGNPVCPIASLEKYLRFCRLQNPSVCSPGRLQLQWTASGTLLFPWERTGCHRCYPGCAKRQPHIHQPQPGNHFYMETVMWGLKWGRPWQQFALTM